MAHNCSTALLHCMDFRFLDSINIWMAEEDHLGNADLITCASPVRQLNQPWHSSSRKFVLKQIALSQQLHKINTVVLMSHADCGACTDLGPFDSAEHEEGIHAELLNNAAKLVAKTMPGMTIKKAFATMSPEGGIKIKYL